MYSYLLHVLFGSFSYAKMTCEQTIGLFSPRIGVSIGAAQSIFQFARAKQRRIIILTRLNHAKHLLKTTDLPVKIIAQNVGYQNVSTFTNAFTNRVGISPSTFREYPI